MRMVDVNPDRVAYDSRTDTLFASFGPFDLTCLDHEDEPREDVFLQYVWPSCELAGLEIWNYSRHFGPLPMLLELPEEGFAIRIPSPVPSPAMAVEK